MGFVILIFSFVLSRYFIKPIQNLVSYTKVIKEKSQTKTNIDSLKSRNDELGLLSNSLDDMTIELQKRVEESCNVKKRGLQWFAAVCCTPKLCQISVKIRESL